MPRWIRRLLVSTILGVGAGVSVRMIRSRAQPIDAGTESRPEWPPFERDPADWIDPVDGQCPSDFSIKANINSGIYHLPGGRSYDRTRAERCYAVEDAAQRDGYRRAKT